MQHLYYQILLLNISVTSINRHVFMNTKPCINETFHVLLMTCFAPLHMQDTEHYSSHTEASPILQLQVSMKDLLQELNRFFLILK